MLSAQREAKRLMERSQESTQKRARKRWVVRRAEEERRGEGGRKWRAAKSRGVRRGERRVEETRWTRWSIRSGILVDGGAEEDAKDAERFIAQRVAEGRLPWNAGRPPGLKGKQD